LANPHAASIRPRTRDPVSGARFPIGSSRSWIVAVVSLSIGTLRIGSQ
jgi:hypothetical protein